MTALVDSTPSMEDIINGPIRDVFISHAANVAFCLYLQHRHHTVGAGEAVVKVNGTAHLMDDDNIKNIVSFGNKVVPTTWMTSGGEVIPMEFAVVPAGTAAPTPEPAFVSEFLSVLASNGCDGLFGIDIKAEDAWTEITIGDASVVVGSNQSEGYDKDKFIPVTLAFDKEEPKFVVHGRCNITHRHTSTPKPKPR
ncbi:hypothetical protein TWF173_009405 [Orbilia oligospora]|nr:hypothetical protein TWF173_009405 [Orbilia oligospora]